MSFFLFVGSRVSWDQEVWLQPAILPFQPLLAKAMLTYRLNTRPAAYSRASMHDYEGLMYGWESAATGMDISG